MERRADLTQRHLLGSTASPAGRSRFIQCHLELPPSQERNVDGTIPFSLKVMFYFLSPIPCSYCQPTISTCLPNTLHQSVRSFTQCLGCTLACGLLRWPNREVSDSNPVCSGHTPDAQSAAGTQETALSSTSGLGSTWGFLRRGDVVLALKRMGGGRVTRVGEPTGLPRDMRFWSSGKWGGEGGLRQGRRS